MVGKNLTMDKTGPLNHKVSAKNGMAPKGILKNMVQIFADDALSYADVKKRAAG